MSITNNRRRILRTKVKMLCKEHGLQPVADYFIQSNCKKNNLAQLACGCRRFESNSLKHGHNRRGDMSPTYRSWYAMCSRTSNPKAHAYERYGGDGVKVCDRWNPKKGGSFMNFLFDMGERPDGTSIDRYPNPSGSYELGNCRWATVAQQNANRKPRSEYKNRAA